jgi:S-(hydroxymethyl)glutathione synthase
MANPTLHPAIDNGITPGAPGFSGGTLHCHCASDKVEVTLSSDVVHNHACGCSKCWKPAGATFSIIGVIPVANVKVTAHAEKLAIVDESATIQRHACKECGVHLYGRIVKDHAFKGLDFVHAELSDAKGWQAPQFAAFVSSIIEQGYEPTKMDAVRARFKALGLSTYDALSPPLMDALASFTAQKAGTAYVEKAAAKPAAAPKAAPAPAAKPQTFFGWLGSLFGGK